MIEKLKTDFSNLLAKIDAIDISASSSSNDALENEFSNIENEYKKIRRVTLTKLEEMKITSDILNHSHSSNHIENPNDSLKQATDKIISEIGPFEMQENLIPFYIKKGKWLLEQERIDEALDAWENVLKFNPSIDYIHCKLNNFFKNSKEEESRIDNLIKKYRIKYLNSFDNKYFKFINSVAYCSINNQFLVNDYYGNKLHKFSSTGKYISQVDLKLNKPRQIIGSRNYFCLNDFGNKRILLLDDQLDIIKEILLVDILNNKKSGLLPYNISIDNNSVYVSLSNEIKETPEIIELDLYNYHCHVVTIPINKKIDSFVVNNYKIYFHKYNNGNLEIYDLRDCSYQKIPKNIKIGPIRDFTILNNYIYAITPNKLVKLTINGNVVFLFDIRNIESMRNILLSSISKIATRNKDILCIFDKQSKRVLCFQV